MDRGSANGFARDCVLLPRALLEVRYLGKEPSIFFDGISLLIPSYMKEERHRALEPHIAESLESAGLLHVLEPERVVDADATQRLHTAMMLLLDSGRLETLAKDKESAFAAISYSRMGGFGDKGLANELIERLKAKGLETETEDGVSVPLHPVIRQVVLAFLSQILRPQGRGLGLDLAPATDDWKLVDALEEFIGFCTPASPARTVVSDLETVGVDVSDVPIDELLDFRKQNLKSHRDYARSVRRFVRDMSRLPPKERREAEEDRRSEIEDFASDVKRTSRQAWHKPASFGLGAAGAAWTFYSGDPMGAVLGAGAALLGASSFKDETGAFTYIFRAAREIY